MTNKIFDVSRPVMASSPGTHCGSDVGPGLFKKLSRYVLYEAVKIGLDIKIGFRKIAYHLFLDFSTPFAIIAIIYDCREVYIDSG